VVAHRCYELQWILKREVSEGLKFIRSTGTLSHSVYITHTHICAVKLYIYNINQHHCMALWVAHTTGRRWVAGGLLDMKKNGLTGQSFRISSFLVVASYMQIDRLIAIHAYYNILYIIIFIVQTYIAHGAAGYDHPRSTYIKYFTSNYRYRDLHPPRGDGPRVTSLFQPSPPPRHIRMYISCTYCIYIKYRVNEPYRLAELCPIMWPPTLPKHFTVVSRPRHGYNILQDIIMYWYMYLRSRYRHSHYNAL